MPVAAIMPPAGLNPVRYSRCEEQISLTPGRMEHCSPYSQTDEYVSHTVLESLEYALLPTVEWSQNHVDGLHFYASQSS